MKCVLIIARGRDLRRIGTRKRRRVSGRRQGNRGLPAECREGLSHGISRMGESIHRARSVAKMRRWGCSEPVAKRCG